MPTAVIITLATGAPPVPAAAVWTGPAHSVIQHHSDSEIQANTKRQLKRFTTRRTTTKR